MKFLKPNWIKDKRSELLLIMFTGMAAVLLGAAAEHTVVPAVMTFFAGVAISAMVLFMLSLFGIIDL